jgi:hypothetical protein
MANTYTSEIGFFAKYGNIMLKLILKRSRLCRCGLKLYTRFLSSGIFLRMSTAVSEEHVPYLFSIEE